MIHDSFSSRERRDQRSAQRVHFFERIEKFRAHDVARLSLRRYQSRVEVAQALPPDAFRAREHLERLVLLRGEQF